MQDNKSIFSTSTLSDHSFLVQLPFLLRATADDQEATPGYMLAEIEKISYEYSHHGKQLAAFLARRLEKNSPHVKLKVLKIMDHLVREGHANVRIALRNNYSSIKMSTMYHGAPDPLTGTILYDTVRKHSKELLEILFLPEKIEEDEKNGTESKQNKQFLGALGSSIPSEGKYQGFGNSPIVKEETIADKVLNYFDKLSKTSDQSEKIIKDGIASSIGHYEAVHIPVTQQFIPAVVRNVPSFPVQSLPASTIKAHVPGRAGGGWEDSDDEGDQKTSHHPSLLSEDSLETLDVILENSEEKELVKKFCNDEKLSINWNELSNMRTSCIKLSSSEVLRAISEELNSTGTIPTLILLDVLLNSEILATTQAITEAYQLLNGVLTKIANDSNAPNLNRSKAAKIMQIIDVRLSLLEDA